MEKNISSFIGTPICTCLIPIIVPFSVSQVGPSITVTCTEGKWNKQVACEPVDCGIPDHHHVYAASFSCPEGTTFGRRCSFQCRHPAQLKGILSSLSQPGLYHLWELSGCFPTSFCISGTIRKIDLCLSWFLFTIYIHVNHLVVQPRIKRCVQ